MQTPKIISVVLLVLFLFIAAGTHTWSQDPVPTPPSEFELSQLSDTAIAAGDSLLNANTALVHADGYLRDFQNLKSGNEKEKTDAYRNLVIAGFFKAPAGIAINMLTLAHYDASEYDAALSNGQSNRNDAVQAIRDADDTYDTALQAYNTAAALYNESLGSTDREQTSSGKTRANILTKTIKPFTGGDMPGVGNTLPDVIRCEVPGGCPLGLEGTDRRVGTQHYVMCLNTRPDGTHCQQHFWACKPGTCYTYTLPPNPITGMQREPMPVLHGNTEGTSFWDCGHPYAEGTSADHAKIRGSCDHVYYKCTPGIHVQTLGCGETRDVTGQIEYCVEVFWKCQPHFHHKWSETKPSELTSNIFRNNSSGNTSSLEVGRGLCSGGCGYLSSAVDHLIEDCVGCGGDYYSCDTSEDHSLQASCTLGECVSTNFYQCQHRKHEFAGCGHDPLHSKVTIVSCGHYEYSCQIRSHFRISCPKKNGERCTVSGGRYRKCDASHQHQYPSDSVADPGDSDTPLPVVCPANRWTSCGGTTSHETTCAAGHSYYTCNADAVATHSAHTASQTPPDEDPSDSENEESPLPVVCPADRWTSCGGTESHAAACLAGHSYYTCNADAVATHSRHTTSDPGTPTGLGACGIHTIQLGSSSEYSHREVSCPLDANNEACSQGSYYVCSPHTHTYPSSDSGNTNPNPNPLPPVVCPANSWTGCGGTSSHATTCAAGHSYYTCNADAVATHSAHTASQTPPPRPCGHSQSSGGNHSRVSCPSGTTCSPSYSYTCQSHTHSYPAAPVVCPADRWTNCGGTSSHAATCAAGHSYYTCNSDAVTRHSGHTAPPPPPPDDSEDDDSEDDDSDDDSDEPVTRCGAHDWTGCDGAAGDHDATCAAGHSYYTCNTTAAERHAKH